MGIPPIPINSRGTEIKDLERPDVRTLADAAQGGANRHIHLTMQPTRPSLEDAMRILGLLKDPAAEKYDGKSAHRMAITPKPEHGSAAIMGAIGLFYANAVGTSGAVSAGRDWDRLSSAAHRWGLKLVDDKGFPMLLFSDDALVLAERALFEESLLVGIYS